MKKEEIKYELMKDLPFDTEGRIHTEKEWKTILNQFNLNWLFMVRTGWFKETDLSLVGIQVPIGVPSREEYDWLKRKVINLENQLQIMRFPHNIPSSITPLYETFATDGTVPPEWESATEKCYNKGRLDTKGDNICDLTGSK